MMARLSGGWALLRAVHARHAGRYLQVRIGTPRGVVAHWGAGRLSVCVTAAGAGISLEVNGTTTTALPDPKGGARIEAPAPLGAGQATLRFGQPPRTVVLHLPNRWQMRWGAALHMLHFGRTLARATPAILRVLRQPGDIAPQIVLREAMGLSRVANADTLCAARLQPLVPRTVVAPDRPIYLVLPVYNAKEHLVRALDQLEAHTDLPYRLIVVNDASSDPAMAAWLRARLARFAPDTAHLIENERNLGFVHSANLGLALAVEAGAHAVLLNSDSFVPRAWASRLLGPLLADRSVASVTPWSGASGLTTVPVIGPGLPLAHGVADRLDQIAAAQSGARLADLPTGMGFCMAMSADFLARLPQLDTDFATGYGEETDWCLRATALGGRHVAHLGLFVDHVGSASFGTRRRDQLAQKAAATLRARYPRYEAAVTAFVDHDPLLTERLALGIARLAALAAAEAVPIYLAHSLGGGAEIDLAARIARDTATIGGAIVVRVGGLRRWRVELHGAGHVPLCGVTDDAGLITTLLADMRRHVVYGCAVGCPDPLSVMRLLLDLVPASEDRLTVLLHDYFPISPSFTLLGADGWFHGVPDPQTTDPAHCAKGGITLSQWRQGWGEVIARANRVEAFSHASADILRSVWPDTGARMVVAPHVIVPAQAMGKAGQALGILGNIKPHKGAAVLAAIARLRPDLQMILLGSYEPGLPVPRSLRVLGQYPRDQIAALATQAGIGVWLIPSIWPETFCFTLHEALATGLPTMAFDLGAQGEGVRAAQVRGAPAIALRLGTTPEAAARAVLTALAKLPAEPH